MESSIYGEPDYNIIPGTCKQGTVDLNGAWWLGYMGENDVQTKEDKMHDYQKWERDQQVQSTGDYTISCE